MGNCERGQWRIWKMLVRSRMVIFCEAGTMETQIPISMLGNGCHWGHLSYSRHSHNTGRPDERKNIDRPDQLPKQNNSRKSKPQEPHSLKLMRRKSCLGLAKGFKQSSMNTTRLGIELSRLSILGVEEISDFAVDSRTCEGCSRHAWDYEVWVIWHLMKFVKLLLLHDYTTSYQALTNLPSLPHLHSYRIICWRLLSNHLSSTRHPWSCSGRLFALIPWGQVRIPSQLLFELSPSRSLTYVFACAQLRLLPAMYCMLVLGDHGVTW